MAQQASFIRGSFRLLSSKRISTDAILLVNRSIGKYQRASSPWKTAAIATSSAVLLLLATVSRRTFLTSLEKEDESHIGKYGYNEDEPLSYRIEVNFMEKLARKSYLHFREHADMMTTKPSVSSEDLRPPPGVPRTLRILAVDLPEMRHAFRQGQCRAQADKVYPDGVAPDRVVHVPFQGQGTPATKSKRRRSSTESSSTQSSKESVSEGIQLQVEQKAWVTSMVKCVTDGTEQVGVQVMEANTGALNPHNLRRTRQFGKLNYDPGKYATINRKKGSPRKNSTVQAKTKEAATTSDSDTSVVEVAPSVLAAPEDELAAPWNQHAWMEEVKLRISGQVQYGAPLEAAGKWTRYFFGNTYQSTVPSSRSTWSWLSPLAASSDPAGMDGLEDTWASNKPHAVIANGAALQLVPNSLRLLQKECRDHNVPLYVVHDPRVWGGNTHDDLGDVLRELRKTVKSGIVAKSLQHAVGTAFQRGRWVGTLEADTRWQAKETIRKTKESVRNTKETIHKASDARKVKEQMDWKRLDENALEEKLASRGVIQTEKGKAKDDETTVRTYTGGMIALAKRCVADQQRGAAMSTETVPEVEADTDDAGAPQSA
jgi:hypothetical protein